jgi:hypothetical protein
LDEVVKYCQIIAYAAATIGIIFTAFTYRNSNKVKRGEWLKSLFEKFYESENFHEVRRKIEYDGLQIFLYNKEKIVEENEEKLVDYLNFFEFIAILEKRGHINKEEIKDMFGYYLAKMKENNFLTKYLTEYGFENIENLLKKSFLNK